MSEEFPFSTLKECVVYRRRIISACETFVDGIASTEGGPVIDIVDIINNNAPLCANYPLQLDNTGNIPECVDIVPGFCGSILQYVNGAWDIFRSPDITEITVGNTAKPPGANFPDVASALGQSLNTNCKFIRITDNTTDGNLNIPNNTLIYVDSGVTWNVGTLTLNGSFVLIGTNSLTSSIINFTTVGTNNAAIVGTLTDNVWIANCRVNLTVATQILMDPRITTYINNAKINVGNFNGTGLSDATNPFTNLQLNQVNFVGEGIASENFLSLSNNTSQFTAYRITVEGTFRNNSLGIVCNVAASANQFRQWYGINFATASFTQHRLSGQVYNVNDRNTTTTIFLTNFCMAKNIITREISINGTDVILHNAVTSILGATAPTDRGQWSDIQTTTLAAGGFKMNNDVQLNNFLLSSGNLVINNILGERISLNNIVIGAGNLVMDCLNTEIININNLILRGNLLFNTVSGVGGNIFISNFFAVLITLGRGIGGGVNQGNATLSNGYILPTPPAGIGYLTVDIFGDIFLNDLLIPGISVVPINFLNCRNLKMANVAITPLCNFEIGCLGVLVSNTTFSNDINIRCNGGVFNNISGIVYPRSLNIIGDNNNLTHVRDTTVAQLGHNSGPINIPGNNNVISDVFSTGGDLFVTGRYNTLSDIRIIGQNNNTTVTNQTFQILGSQTKLSNIYLGAKSLIAVGLTADGFGGLNDASYTVTLGDANTTGLQIDTFCFYPRRGQNFAAYSVFNALLPFPGIQTFTVGDTLNAATPTTPQTFTIGASYSTFNNMRIWSYPGMSSNQPVIVPNFRHYVQATQLTVAATCRQCEFNNIFIGWGQEFPVRTSSRQWSNTTAYTVGQPVIFNFLEYTCLVNNTGNQPPNAAFWTPILQWSYPTTSNVVPGDIRVSGGLQYRCLIANTNIIPQTSPVTWQLVYTWNALTNYNVQDVVLQFGVEYICIAPNIGVIPPNAAFWRVTVPDCGELISAGIGNRFQGVNTFALTETGNNNQYLGCRVRTDNFYNTATITNLANTICIGNSNFVPFGIGNTTGQNVALTSNT